MLFIVDAVDGSFDIMAASFFGFMGVSMALVLASKVTIMLRHRGWIRDLQGWGRNCSHRYLEARSDHEVSHSCRYGGYPGHIRDDCRSAAESERYRLQ